MVPKGTGRAVSKRYFRGRLCGLHDAAEMGGGTRDDGALQILKTLLERAEYLGTETPRRLKHARQGMLIHKARSFVRLDNKLLGVELTIRQDSNGRLFYDHFVFDYPRISRKKRNSPLNHPKVLLDPTNQGGERARSSQPQPVTNSLHWTRD